MYSINFSATRTRLCLSLHYNGDNSYLFVNGKEMIKFKAKDSEIVANPFCLGNISKDFSQRNMKKTGLNGSVYYFSTYHNVIAVDDILDIHGYLYKNMSYNINVEFIKKVFVVAMTFFNLNLSNLNTLECVSVNNQECKPKTKIIIINRNEPVFYPYSIKTNKCRGSCNTINDPYAKLCVSDTIKSINVKVFNLMSRTNEKRHIEWHEICKCKFRLDASVCNNKQRWNEGKCRCECKELIDKGMCDEGFIWNPSNCDCECDKSCGVGEYLDYKTVSVEKE